MFVFACTKLTWICINLNEGKSNNEDDDDGSERDQHSTVQGDTETDLNTVLIHPSYIHVMMLETSQNIIHTSQTLKLIWI